MQGNEDLSTKAKVLERLRAAGTCISGEDLSRDLNVSRTSVWKAVQSLKSSGYSIDSHKNGYVLEEKNPDSICPVEFAGEEKLFIHYDSVGSTMDEARKVAMQSLEQDSRDVRIVTADEQLSGRGKGDRIWKTVKGSLAFTMVTYPSLSTRSSSRQLMAAQISLASALEKMTGRIFYVRWPNDVWSENGKVAGVLDEEFSCGGKCLFVNLGIGVNVSRSPRMKGVDKALCGFLPQARKNILSSFYEEFCKLEGLVVSQDDSLQRMWNRKNFDEGKRVRAFDGGEFTFEKIDYNGCAVMSTADDTKKIFAPGEFSYEKNYA